VNQGNAGRDFVVHETTELPRWEILTFFVRNRPVRSVRITGLESLKTTVPAPEMVTAASVCGEQFS
jgi:hypothetical protein